MRDSDIDRVLSTTKDIAPSPGFADSVMEAVRREALQPPDIRVPWNRALAGTFAAGIALAWLALQTIKALTPQGAGAWLASNVRPLLEMSIRAQQTFGVGWIALALLLSFLSVKLSSRAVSNRI